MVVNECQEHRQICSVTHVIPRAVRERHDHTEIEIKTTMRYTLQSTDASSNTKKARKVTSFPASFHDPFILSTQMQSDFLTLCLDRTLCLNTMICTKGNSGQESSKNGCKICNMHGNVVILVVAHFI